MGHEEFAIKKRGKIAKRGGNVYVLPFTSRKESQVKARAAWGPVSLKLARVQFTSYFKLAAFGLVF